MRTNGLLVDEDAMLGKDWVFTCSGDPVEFSRPGGLIGRYLAAIRVQESLRLSRVKDAGEKKLCVGERLGEHGETAHVVIMPVRCDDRLNVSGLDLNLAEVVE
jgi:hypothetical protein